MTLCMPPEYRSGRVTETWRDDRGTYTISFDADQDPVDCGAHGNKSRAEDTLVASVVTCEGLPDLDWYAWFYRHA